MSEKHVVTVTSAVDPDWIAFCTNNSDIFMRSYCGYWLRGVESDKVRGLLVWEDNEQHAPGDEPNRREAIRAWKKGEPLPAGWHRLDTAVAVKAWGVGVLTWGEMWYAEGDADRYDYVIQKALFGEQRYG
ncbi:MAG: hypothetical protein EKK62_04120 [Acidimicrobiia bacterium]|nr:MAG: hypothetical protein EKK62_04120 [Acidimicrobiia bacterium]